MFRWGVLLLRIRAALECQCLPSDPCQAPRLVVLFAMIRCRISLTHRGQVLPGRQVEIHRTCEGATATGANPARALVLARQARLCRVSTAHVAASYFRPVCFACELRLAGHSSSGHPSPVRRGPCSPDGGGGQADGSHPQNQQGRRAEDAGRRARGAKDRLFWACFGGNEGLST